MYLCYVDESGTSAIPGNTSHFVLAGLAIPIWQWRACDGEIEAIKEKYGVEHKEIHIAWLLRKYLEQSRIDNFEKLDYSQRRARVETYRKQELYRLQRAQNPSLHKQTRKNYFKTQDYIHLSYTERSDLIKEIAACISNWNDARLFAECIDKVYFDPNKAGKTIDEQSFEQIVSRFEQFLRMIGRGGNQHRNGLIIYDNNQTVARKHTDMMKQFHQTGTLWTNIEHIIETPLFVDSQLTSMVQIADVCAYLLRRYLENGEDSNFARIFSRADRKDEVAVGVRHFTAQNCKCMIYTAHRKGKQKKQAHSAHEPREVYVAPDRAAEIEDGV